VRTGALLAAGVAIALALFLTACGGGGGSSTFSTSATATRAEPTSAAPTETNASRARAKARRERAAEIAPPPKSHPPRALVRKAGRAAPFLVSTGDNSIPTYGSESSATQIGQATASLRAYLQARAKGDWSAACAQMASTVRKQLALLAGEKSKECAAAYAKLASRIPASARANPLIGSLTAFRVKGIKAFALFYGPHRQKYMVPMASEGGAWKVTQLEPIPWPVGAPSKSP
jgi:hypothetical protein